MSTLTSFARIWLTRSFKAFEFEAEYEPVLDYAETDHLGLYVHIPFCRSICTFCPYCKTVYDKEVAATYIKALKKEIEAVGEMHGTGKKEVTSLYFGGGTPALLAEAVGDIIKTVNTYFTITEGIGIELHPLDVNAEKLQILKSAGVTKISIGIQSFQSDYLTSLGRQLTDYEEMFRALKEVPFETVSMDFIFALPGQTIESVKKDIGIAFDNGANHIAVYPFIDFTYTDHDFRMMGNTEKRQLLYDIVAYCREMGYHRDSIWTFSKEKNARYSSMTRENFLGFGCSATTLLKDSFKINTFDVDEYVKRVSHGELPTALTHRFSLRQRMVYYLFWTFYTMRLEEARFNRFFGKSLKRYYGLELLIGRLIGVIKRTKRGYQMTTKGSYYYHYFEHFYTLSYIDQMWSTMSKEAFPERLVIK